MHTISHDPLRNYISNNLHNYLSETLPSLNNQICTNNTNLAIEDSETTRNYLSTEAPLLNVKPTTTGPKVILPENTTITATHEGILDLPTLPTKAKIVHVFPTLVKAILSIASMRDAGGTATFAAKEVTVNFNGKIALQGPRYST